MKRQLALTLKMLFVAGCCTAAAWAAQAGFSYNHIAANAGTACLFCLLVFASWLNHRRRASASWAVLAYGSWMTIYVMAFLAVCSSLATTPWYSRMDAWGTLAAIAAFAYGGLNHALRGRWSGVLQWWLFSSLLYSLLSLLGNGG